MVLAIAALESGVWAAADAVGAVGGASATGCSIALSAGALSDSPIPTDWPARLCGTIERAGGCAGTLRSVAAAKATPRPGLRGRALTVLQPSCDDGLDLSVDTVADGCAAR